MPFHQTPPALANQYTDDPLLRAYLRRALPPEILPEIEPTLVEMGELAGGELYELQLADRLNEPRLVQWDAWGRRVDRIEHTPLWRRAEELAARRGLVATAYERAHGRHSRIHQAALVYLFTPSTDIYSCPLAMTDAAAKTLLLSGNQRLIERAVPHLTSRDPAGFWTSGQWMTEAIGGSDVGQTETVARPDGDGGWRLYGRKWFTSAADSQMALTLARPEGQGPGGRNLALFYLETRDADGRPRNLTVERLKDKLGTRKLPTAELTLDGTPAELVLGTTDGVKNIAPMLNITRVWNGLSAVALMRRGLALARDYAAKRTVFGAPLAEKPLHRDLMAGLDAELQGAFHLTFRVVELLGAEESGEATPEELDLLRLLTPIMKLTTAKQAVAVTSEVLEIFGGAGYVEDTGLPTLLRDAQVLPIWEGTTDVLALDVLRVIGQQGGIGGIRREIEAAAGTEGPGAAATAAIDGFGAAAAWLEGATADGSQALEAGARRFALALGRALELSLVARHARWALDSGVEDGSPAAARRLARTGHQRPMMAR
jgi:alkylation response protein AidB-like acyl-CoA dehydrogenase